jgi:hypothetical protein
MTSDIADYKLVLTVLHYALIEIRAAEDLREAQALANVFHNVPNGIASGRSPEDIRAQLDQTAARLGCQSHINSLFNSVVKNMKQ